MTRTARRGPLAAGTALATGLVLLAGCTSGAKPQPAADRDPAVPAGAMRLVSFDSCADALARLKQAAKPYVGPYGFGYGDVWLDGVMPRTAADAPGDARAGAQAKAPQQPNHSGTNTHEAGVDEPDLVKTDGRRIVTVQQGELHVVDVASRRTTGRLDLKVDRQDPIQWSGADLLLHGDRALVLTREAMWAGPAFDTPGKRPGVPPTHQIVGVRLLLVDLVGTPRVVSELRFDGGLVDARQVGATARVVVRSTPRLTFPYRNTGSEAERTAANRKLLDRSAIEDWLPRYELTGGGRVERGNVGCAGLSRPAKYSGTSMVSVLTFDLGAAALGNGDPLTVVADGETVYSNGPSLYLANDPRSRVVWSEDPARRGKPSEDATELYKFDTSQPGRPRYVAAGEVPGWLINQYAMSEWDGNLRVATTTGQAWGTNAKSVSTVYVLDGSLRPKGEVSGLGKGERIYAVRFAGPVGYVVTFRQTDPLYTVDLSDPARPRVTGELKITGYSAYLHPVDRNRLIGVGQEASGQGRTQGTQVSLFDVSNLERPVRVAQHHVRHGYSEAESDPHAFLYWPADRLLVLPVASYSGRGTGSSALVLRVTDGGFTEVGGVSHAATEAGRADYRVVIRRSLVIDGVLWTVSDAGLKATNMSTLDTMAWLAWS